MRDEYFSVSGVFESDVIHASKKDIPCIFRVTTSMLGDDGSQRFTQLFLVDRESEKNKWIDALHELHRIIRRNKLPNRNALRVYPLMTSFQLPALRHPNNINCCCIIDVTRLLIGCEDCLVCCDLDTHSYRRLTNSKKILLCSYSPTDQLVVVLAGKQRHIKLIPTRGLDEDNIEWIKVTETKGATTFVIVPLPSDTFICVAIKKTLLIYQVNRKKTRYTFWREIQMPLNIQTLTCHDNMIAVGTNSNFVVYAVNNREQPPLYLVNQDCPQLSYLTQNSIDGFTCQSVSDKEWVLLFAHYGVYVDNNGRRSRSQELMFPTQPLYVSIMEANLPSSNSATKLLLAFSSTHIDVYDLHSTQWIQTINLKNTKPLDSHATNCSLLCLSSCADPPLLVNIVPSGRHDLLLKVTGDPNKPFTATGISGAQRLIQSAAGAVIDRPAKARLQISGPSDFSHISHLGPGSGPFTSNLIDLTKGSASQSSLLSNDGNTPTCRGRRDSTSSSQSQSSLSPYKF